MQEIRRAGIRRKSADRVLVGWAGEHVADKDAPILAAAVASGAKYLVTGDSRHFGHLFGMTVRSVTVATLTEALDRVLAPDP